MYVSSAKIQDIELRLSTMSFTYNKKSKGPGTACCGTISVRY